MSEHFQPRQDHRPNDVVWPEAQWPPAANVVLVGPHVSLSQYVPDDADELFAALDHDSLWSHVRGRFADVSHLREVLDAAPATNRYPYVVRLSSDYKGHATGTVVGYSSLFDGTSVNAWCEIGFTAYSPDFWGSAVNPETKLLLLGFCFDGLKMGRVQLKTDVRNHRSQQAIARLGATYEGVLRRFQRRADGTVRDSVLFSITAEEWPAVRSTLRSRLAEA